MNIYVYSSYQKKIEPLIYHNLILFITSRFDQLLSSRFRICWYDHIPSDLPQQRSHKVWWGRCTPSLVRDTWCCRTTQIPRLWGESRATVGSWLWTIYPLMILNISVENGLFIDENIMIYCTQNRWLSIATSNRGYEFLCFFWCFFVGLQISGTPIWWFLKLLFSGENNNLEVCPHKKPHPDPVKLRKLLEVSFDGNDTI